MKLIDTDIVIDHFHGHRAAHEYFASILASNEILAISVITLTEITSGMRADSDNLRYIHARFSYVLYT